MGSARPRLYSLAVELTAHCNQKCDYCYNEWRDDDGHDLGAPAKDQLLARVDKVLDAIDVDHVTLTGGEPLANHDVFDVLDRLRERGVGVQMISNGGLITDRLAARLASYPMRFVQVTLDGADAATHEAHVGEGRNHFEKTLAGVRALLAHGVPVVGCVVITRKNALQVGAILELWRSLGVQHVALSRFSPAGYAAQHAAALMCSVPDATAALEQALPFAQGGMRLTSTMPLPPCAVEVERFAPIRFGACPIGTEMQEVVLGPGGELRNCTLHRAAFGGVQDVLDPAVDVAALLDAPERAAYQSRHPEFCEGCKHVKTCGGGCGAAAEWLLGDARSTPDPFVWQHIDEAFAARLREARDHAKVKTTMPDKRRLEVLR